MALDSADILSGGVGTIEVQSSNGSITLSTDSQLDAGTGNISLTAAQDVGLGDLQTSGTGEILVEARDGDINVGGVVQSDADIALDAGQDINVGADIESDGRITLEADGVIRGDGASEVRADTLLMKGYGPQPGDGAPVKTDVSNFELEVPRGLVSTITRPDGSLSFVVFADGKVYQQSSNVDSTVTRVTDRPGSGVVILPPPRVLPDPGGPIVVSFEDALEWIRNYRANPEPEPAIAPEEGGDDESGEGEAVLGVSFFSALAGDEGGETEGDTSNSTLPGFELQGDSTGDSFDQQLSLDTASGEEQAFSGLGDPVAIPTDAADEVGLGDLTFFAIAEAEQTGEQLEVAYLLGEPANQPWGAGAAVNDAFYFDYWVDGLAV